MGERWLKGDAWTVRDEFYTPKLLVEAIVPYIPAGATVWCPFDTATSEFVLVLQEKGIKVVYSHIIDDKDFFKYTPEHFDLIISNPPFSRKIEVINRCYALGKPFALLLPLTILNYQEIGTLFMDKPLQLLIVDKKVSYNGHTSSFNTSYYCKGLLPRDIIFTSLPHNNSGKHYVASRMKLE